MAEIVAADDDRQIQDVVKRTLDAAGHEVTVCDDGGELVEEVRARHPDVVITDNHMPVMTGLEAIETLHADPETNDIPAVLASGSVTEAEAARVLTDGDQLVTKPFTSAELKTAVDAATRHAEAQRDQPTDDR